MENMAVKKTVAIEMNDFRMKRKWPVKNLRCDRWDKKSTRKNVAGAASFRKIWEDAQSVVC